MFLYPRASVYRCRVKGPLLQFYVCYIALEQRGSVGWKARSGEPGSGVHILWGPADIFYPIFRPQSGKPRGCLAPATKQPRGKRFWGALEHPEEAGGVNPEYPASANSNRLAGQQDSKTIFGFRSSFFRRVTSSRVEAQRVFLSCLSSKGFGKGGNREFCTLFKTSPWSLFAPFSP